jgi:hypothetical protein
MRFFITGYCFGVPADGKAGMIGKKSCFWQDWNLIA